MSSMSPALPDVQNALDERALAIDQVGICDLCYPLQWQEGDLPPQPIVAECSLTVGLSARHRGTHMSRFIALLEERDEPLSLATMADFMAQMLQRLEAESGSIALRFPFFLHKKAPISGTVSRLDYRVTALARCREGKTETGLRLRVPVTSLCPSSKALADYGAHNQRAEVHLAAWLHEPLSLAALIAQLELAASCELFALLKREDEKYVTERAYERPRFVEDLVREMALQLDRQQAFSRYRLAVRNFEAIHNHSAFACIERR